MGGTGSAGAQEPRSPYLGALSPSRTFLRLRIAEGWGEGEGNGGGKEEGEMGRKGKRRRKRKRKKKRRARERRGGRASGKCNEPRSRTCKFKSRSHIY